MRRFFIVMASLWLASPLTGCLSTGTELAVGENWILPELTTASGEYSIKLYEDIKGARIWARKDSEITVEYRCAYTNSYCGIVDTQSDMALTVRVTPLATDPDQPVESRDVPSREQEESN